MPNADDTFYKLLDEHCIAEQIKDLMRETKKNVAKEVAKEIVLGDNKEETIKNLRHAIAHNAISFEDAANLLREAEENGRQHIFFFKAANASVRSLLRRPDEIISRLFGDEYDYMGFPRFERTPDQYEWADFRTQYRSKPRDWVAKLYGHETRLSFVSEKRTVSGGIIKHWEPEVGRTVLVARWNDPDVMEIRIDNWSITRDSLKQRVRTLFEFLAPALSPDDLRPWDLQVVRQNIVKDRTSNGKLYHVGGLELLDSHSGRNTFMPRSDEETADDATERAKAIDALIGGKATCRTSVVRWLSNGADGSLSEDLRTVCGSNDSHELTVSSRVSSVALDYVTDQLRSFDR